MALTDVLLSDSEVREVLKTYFNLDARIYKLPGDVDLNYRVELDSIPRYVLKVSRNDDHAEAIEYQVALFEHLRSWRSELNLPCFVRSINDKAVEIYKAGDQTVRLVRLLEWVPRTLVNSPLCRSAKVDSKLRSSPNTKFRPTEPVRR